MPVVIPRHWVRATVHYRDIFMNLILIASDTFTTTANLWDGRQRNEDHSSIPAQQRISATSSHEVTMILGGVNNLAQRKYSTLILGVLPTKCKANDCLGYCTETS